ncbi:MAG: hypothetical protein WA705_12205 [Candidatus Ozemobacteraceae bacterium]
MVCAVETGISRAGTQIDEGEGEGEDKGNGKGEDDDDGEYEDEYGVADGEGMSSADTGRDALAYSCWDAVLTDAGEFWAFAGDTLRRRINALAIDKMIRLTQNVLLFIRSSHFQIIPAWYLLNNSE